jgi:hypothetical protein
MTKPAMLRALLRSRAIGRSNARFQSYGFNAGLQVLVVAASVVGHGGGGAMKVLRV